MGREAGSFVSLKLENLTNSSCSCRLVRAAFADVVVEVVVRVCAFVIAGW